MEELRYPIGRFQQEGAAAPEQVKKWIREIEQTPEQLKLAIAGLTEEQLDTPYRPGGWTVRQVVHHLADSHMNSFIRFKLALTESNPAISPYKEELWAELPDSALSVEASLTILEGLHKRWFRLLETMETADFEKTFRHPESGLVKLGTNIGLYAWHGRHHSAQITSLRKRLNW